MKILMLLLILNDSSALTEAIKIWGLTAQTWKIKIENHYSTLRDPNKTINVEVISWEYCIGFKPIIGDAQKVACSFISWEDAFEKRATEERLSKRNPV